MTECKKGHPKNLWVVKELTITANCSPCSCTHSVWVYIHMYNVYTISIDKILCPRKKNAPRSFIQSKALLDVALLKACTLKLHFPAKSSLTSRSIIWNLKSKSKVLIPCSLKPAGILPTFWVGIGWGCKWVYLPNDSFISNICRFFCSAKRFLWRLLLNTVFCVKP